MKNKECNIEYYQVVYNSRKLGMQEIAGQSKTLDEAKQKLEDFKKYYDDLYIIAKIKID